MSQVGLRSREDKLSEIYELINNSGRAMYIQRLLMFIRNS